MHSNSKKHSKNIKEIINHIKPVLVKMTEVYIVERNASWTVWFKAKITEGAKTVKATISNAPVINYITGNKEPTKSASDKKVEEKTPAQQENSDLQRFEFCEQRQKNITEAKTPLDLIKLCYLFGNQGRKALKEAYYESETCNWANGMRSTIIHLMTSNKYCNPVFEAELKSKRDAKQALEIALKKTEESILVAMEKGQSEIDVRKLEEDLKNIIETLHTTILDLADLNDTRAIIEAKRLGFFEGFAMLEKTKDTAAPVDAKYEHSVNPWIPLVYQKTWYRIYFNKKHLSDKTPTFETFVNQYAVSKEVENNELPEPLESSLESDDDGFNLVTPTPSNSPVAPTAKLVLTAGKPPPVPPRPSIKPALVQPNTGKTATAAPTGTPNPDAAKDKKLSPTPLPPTPAAPAPAKESPSSGKSTSKPVPPPLPPQPTPKNLDSGKMTPASGKTAAPANTNPIVATAATVTDPKHPPALSIDTSTPSSKVLSTASSSTSILASLNQDPTHTTVVAESPKPTEPILAPPAAPEEKAKPVSPRINPGDATAIAIAAAALNSQTGPGLHCVANNGGSVAAAAATSTHKGGNKKKKHRK